MKWVAGAAAPGAVLGRVRDPQSTGRAEEPLLADLLMKAHANLADGDLQKLSNVSGGDRDASTGKQPVGKLGGRDGS